MRKFNLFVIGVAIILFIVSLLLAQTDSVSKNCLQLPTAMTKTC